MKNILTTIVKIFNWLCVYLRKKDRFDFQVSAKLIILSFAVAVTVCYFGNERAQRMALFGFIFVLFTLMLIFNFDTENKLIYKLTKREKNTLRQLLGEMSHRSYLFGLVIFSTEASWFLWIIITSICAMIFDKILKFDILILWLLAAFAYTFVYFLYHIYFNKKAGIEIIQQRIQFYSAIGTTFSFLFLLLGANDFFRIFITGTMLEFTWLQYIIIKEKNNFVQG